jgi:hypothetical protein
VVPAAAQAQRDYRSLKQSSFDPTGGNHDFWAIPADGVREVPGVITHIWFTIAARSTYHLKEIVLQAILGRQPRTMSNSPSRKTCT